MRALVLEAPGRAAVETLDDPVPGPGQVVVAVDSCGVCGTDEHIYDGDFAPTPYPIVPGHEFSGEVAAVGEGVSHVQPGTAVAVDPTLPCGWCEPCKRGRTNLCDHWGGIGVTADGAFAEYVAVPAANVYPLPEGVPAHWGPLIEPLSCAVHALDRIAWTPTDDVLIYGAGTMGLLLARLLRHAGAGDVEVVDRNPDRLPRAQRMGAAATAVSADELDRGRWDLVVDATGSPAAMEDGIPRVARGGTFLVFGVSSPKDRVSFAPFRVYNDEIAIVGSMAVLRSFGRARDLMADGVIDGDELITSRRPLEDYEAAIGDFRAGTELKIQLSPKLGARRPPGAG